MVQFVGTYQLVSEENIDNYYKAVGLPEDRIKTVKETTSTYKIVALDDKKIEFSFGPRTVELLLNQETDVTSTSGLKLKMFASVSGDTITVKTRRVDDSAGDEDVKIYSVTADGLAATYTVKGVTAKRQFKRV